MDPHFNENEVLNSIVEVLAERRAIRHKLMTAIQEIREIADRSALGANVSERALQHTLYETSDHTSEAVDHRHLGSKAKSN